MKQGVKGRALWMVLVLLVGCAPAKPTAPQHATVTVMRPPVTFDSTGVEQTTEVPTTDTTGTETTLATEVTTTASGSSTSLSTNTTSAQTSGTTTKPTTTAKPTTTTSQTSGTTMPRPTRDDEMRAVWVSYIEVAELFNGCSTAAQARAATDALMDKMVRYKMNTVFFHVRANSDAYYISSLFKTATAVEKLVKAGFDPLAYAVEAAHKRGIELHAWINPYRVGKQAAYIVGNTPTMQDESGRYYYVPTSAVAQKLILDGVREIVNKYAVDGIQYDDYFYPSGLLKEKTVYNFESADYEAYRGAGGSLSVADWRRAGVDALIAGTHTVTSAKGVVFGVSPAVSADNTYTALYADCRKWLAESGYVDYLCPQVYTGFEHGGSPFDKMVDAWMGYPRHSSVDLYIGVALYKIGLKSDPYAGAGKTEWAQNSDIMKRSVEYLRTKKIKGLFFYSFSYFEPASKAGLSSTNDVSVAEKEIRNLLSIL